MPTQNLQDLFFNFFKGLVDVFKNTEREFYMKNLMAVLVSCLALVACNPFKVSDPSDPRFDPMQFKFSDYRGTGQLPDVLRTIFPPGTKKEFVDKVLVNSGRAKINQASGKLAEGYQNYWVYIMPKRWKNIKAPNAIFITYDKNNNIVAATMTGMELFDYRNGEQNDG